MTTYTFKLGTQQFDIEADNKLDAFVLANDEVRHLPVFYTWMETGQPNTYRATRGVWD